jgi:hypothetical protein
MKVYAATVDVRHTRWWIPGVLQDVAIKASSESMAVKRAVTMARRALPRGTRVVELKVQLRYVCTEKPVQLVKDLGVNPS